MFQKTLRDLKNPLKFLEHHERNQILKVFFFKGKKLQILKMHIKSLPKYNYFALL